MSDRNVKNTINAPQALFGTLFGLWFGTIVHSVFGCKSMAPGILFDLNTAQIIFVFGSLVDIGAFIIWFIKFQQYVLTIPSERNSRGRRIGLGKHFLKMFCSFLICVILIFVFVHFTQLYFMDSVSDLMKLFGIAQPIIWMIMDMFIVLGVFFQGKNNLSNVRRNTTA